MYSCRLRSKKVTNEQIVAIAAPMAFHGAIIRGTCGVPNCGASTRFGRNSGKTPTTRSSAVHKKKRGPIASLVSQSGLRQPISRAPAAYCFDIRTLRASRTLRLSAPEHHRYVRVLDWKVAHESTKNGSVQARFRL